MRCVNWLVLLCISLTPFIWGAFVDNLKLVQHKTPVRSIRNIDYIYVINLDHRPEKFEQTLQQLAPYGIVPYRFSAINGWKLPIEAIWDIALQFKAGMRPGGMGTIYRICKGKQYRSHEIIEKEGEPYFCHGLSQGAIGCVLSHLSVIQDAYNSGYGVVWICEDDIEVVQDPRVLSQYIDDLESIVGKGQWDLLFTFRDYRGPGGEYFIPYGADYRPDIETRNQERFNINIPISAELRQVGTRFGTQSMIWSRSGMEKILNFYKEHKVFLPYDLELALVPELKMYSVLQDIVTNKLNSISDIGIDVAR